VLRTQDEVTNRISDETRSAKNIMVSPLAPYLSERKADMMDTSFNLND
jgi:hypothetical protein